MYQLTKEIRRSTEDVDVDLIKLSIENERLIAVFNEIGSIKDGLDIQFEVNKDKITNLNHETYEGKRLILIFTDNTNDKLTLKLDIGVHKRQQIEQDTLLFDMIQTDDSIELFVNPVEQMIVEKTSSFIKFGILSTRMKDLFDIYYLIHNHTYSRTKITKLVDIYFIQSKQVSSLTDYIKKKIEMLESEILIDNLSKSTNWLEIDVQLVVVALIRFFTSLQSV